PTMAINEKEFLSGLIHKKGGEETGRRRPGKKEEGAQKGKKKGREGRGKGSGEERKVRCPPRGPAQKGKREEEEHGKNEGEKNGKE
ncbi:hypothetical protein, partial [Salmonella enterica]|uniref:hypothetical protein n=1 Tax=Salmonella enterica TaxID=28901 RepID=UPI001C6102CB